MPAFTSRRLVRVMSEEEENEYPGQMIARRLVSDVIAKSQNDPAFLKSTEFVSFANDFHSRIKCFMGQAHYIMPDQNIPWGFVFDEDCMRRMKAGYESQGVLVVFARMDPSDVYKFLVHSVEKYGMLRSCFDYSTGTRGKGYIITVCRAVQADVHDLPHVFSSGGYNTCAVPAHASGGYSPTEEDVTAIVDDVMRQQGYPDYTYSVIVSITDCVECTEPFTFNREDDIRKAIMTNVINKTHTPK